MFNLDIKNDVSENLPSTYLVLWARYVNTASLGASVPGSLSLFTDAAVLKDTEHLGLASLCRDCSSNSIIE